MSSAEAALPILVAEDNAISRELIVQQLHLLGHASVVCVDGTDTLRAWRSRRFAMLLTDLQMPGLDGYQLAAQIRSEETSRRMPIVALTGRGPDDEAERCAAAGIDDSITKPATLDTLRRALAKWAAAPPTST